jgi:hypothetical protein
MMVLDPEPSRQDRTGRNPNRARLEFKDAVAGATAKVMVMTSVRGFKMGFLTGEQHLDDRTSLAQQTNRAVDGRQSKTRHALPAALEDASDRERPFSSLDNLENRLALTGVALRAHGPRISLGK